MLSQDSNTLKLPWILSDPVWSESIEGTFLCRHSNNLKAGQYSTFEVSHAALNHKE